MYEVNLTSQEKEQLERRHRKARDSNESDRIKAVLLRSEGWSVSAIAQALRVHESTITRQIKDYLNESKLTLNKGRSSSFLTEQQTEALVFHLRTNLYQHTYQIADYIEKRWGIRYSTPGLNKLLHRLDFTYKKPKGRPYQAEPVKQAAFIKTYRRLKGTVGPKESIIFMDAAHPTQATKLSYGWIKKGETIEVPTTASRTRINLIGGIELRDIGKTVTASYETVNTDSVIDFLGQIREQYPIKNKLHIILDRAGYHRSDGVKQAAKRLNMRLHYLPAYSPNLNPIERLWKVMNEHVRNNRFFGSAKKFKQRIIGFFNNTLPQIAHTLRSRINDNFQILNPAY